VPAAGGIECPYCHKNVVPKKEAKGDMVNAIMLLVCGIIPRVIYLAKYSGYMTACPECQVKLADAPD
jgi:DNA-directed RNA polymerase subunit RPC12/RpoP